MRSSDCRLSCEARTRHRPISRGSRAHLSVDHQRVVVTVNVYTMTLTMVKDDTATVTTYEINETTYQMLTVEGAAVQSIIVPAEDFTKIIALGNEAFDGSVVIDK